MNLAETYDLLIMIRQFDNRQVDDGTVVAWHATLGDLEYRDCAVGVVDHFRESDDYLKPVHVRRGAERSAERRRIADRDARLAAVPELGAGPTRDRSAEVDQLVAGLRDKLPAGDPDKLRWGHGMWRRNRERRAAIDRAEEA